MKLAFDEVKATQAAALFMKLAGGSLNYMALINCYIGPTGRLSEGADFG